MTSFSFQAAVRNLAKMSRAGKDGGPAPAPWPALLVWIFLLLTPGVAAISLWPWIPVDPGVDSPLAMALADGSISRAVLGLLGFVLLLALVRKVSFAALLIAPFAFLAAPETAYIVVYGGPSTAHILGVIAETNSAEAGDFIGYLPWGVLLAFTTSWALAAWAGHTLWRSRWRWTHRSRIWYVLIVVGVGAVTVRGALMAGAQDNRGSPSSTSLLASATLPEAWSDLHLTYPWGVPFRVAEYFSQRAQIAAAVQRSESVRYGATLKRALGPRTVVLVIGESARADHWGMDGATRDTTPRLAKLPGLVNFSNATSAAAATRISVPFMITPLEAGADLNRTGPGKSIVAAFAEAGYETWWISNQPSVGLFDTPLGSYPREAHLRRFVSLAEFSMRSAYDGALLPEVERALNSPAGHRLIIVHQLGSHWDYAQRYPPEFERWTPTILPGRRWNPFARDMKLPITNAYDNSILYSDAVLAELIALLQRQQQPSALLYASDHGQALFDGLCMSTGHGLLSATNFHVPFFVWMSPALRALEPAAFAALEANRARPITVESIFPTLIELGGILVSEPKRNLSLASSEFSPKARLVTVDAENWINYDRDLPAKDCASNSINKVGNGR